MNKEYKIKLDLNKKLYNKKMAFNQFDENVNDFYIEVTKNNEVVKDLDKSIITLVAIKPNNTVDAQFIEVKEGQIYANLKPSMCDLVGNYQAKAMIVLEGEIVTTDTINYSVSEDKIISRLNEDVVSDERFTLFTDALARLSDIEASEEQRITNEAERILAEENRKIEEAKRVEAELVRQHEEADRAKYDATRESNENIRKQNESIRLANETNRIDEEAKRVDEENKRKLAEEERNANYNFMTEDEERRRSEANTHKEAEVLRVQAETNRVNEEAKRRTTEQARVSAENTRVGNENVREANEVARQNNETKRVEAETQRQNRYNSFIVDAEANANNFENYTNTVKVKEEERKSNELDRKSQEAKRVSNEVERISNENTRKANEVAREKNETSRQNIFENKVDEVNEKIAELNTTKENFVSSVNAKVDNKISEIEVAKSDMTTTVSNKVNEVETRFNALTSSQQQSSEVIDARDGETSLKARLDRDIEKAKQVYVNVEGSNISTDSSSGYAKNVEILGNTIQSASNLADIRSVGDKVEGQELYEIPVVSCGKNLYNGTVHIGKMWDIASVGANLTDETLENASDCNATDIFCIKPNTEYIAHLDGQILGGNIKFYDKDKRYLSQVYVLPTISPENAYYCTIHYLRSSYGDGNTIQIEEGTIATPYEPYQEEKLTILSPVQLEKVGDVRDRIIEKDGVWGVEKNIETFNFSDSYSWSIANELENTVRFSTHIDNLKGANLKTIEQNEKAILISNKFITKSVSEMLVSDFECVGVTSHLSFRVNKSSLSSLDSNGFNSFLINNNVLIKYQTTQPQFIPLPHDQQIKLRTFASKTNISFGCEIEGTIKAQVPKSLGATVNTHTEQIRSLNNELNRVKKLEDSTVSTVTTESDFTTVEATSNGYFEDVKLEGKTLVNIYNHNPSRVVDNQLYGEEALPRITGETCYAYNLSNKVISMAVYRNNNWARGVVLKPLSTVQINLSSEEDLHHIVGAFTDGWTSDDKSVFDKSVIVMREKISIEKLHYFEGLKSVCDGTDEIVVSSVKGDGNLFDDSRLVEDSSKVKVLYNKDGRLRLQGVSGWYAKVLFDEISVKKNTSYWIVGEGEVISGKAQCACKVTDGNGKELHAEFSMSGKVTKKITTTDSNTISLYFRCNDEANDALVEYRDIMLIEDKGYTQNEVVNMSYTPHQSDKKRLLYYNEETQAWEKPILRQWDSIEKHADGKYYYHVNTRYKRVTANDITALVLSNDSSLIRVSILNTSNPKPPSVKKPTLVCGQLQTKDRDELYNFNAGEGVSQFSGTGQPFMVLSASKVGGTTLDKVKEYVTNNVIDFIVPTNSEEIYECTNIDLITYANETNYIVNSGAISPRTTLKVHNNISNVVSLLQKKVSLLESNIKASQEVQDMMILETDMRMLDIELALMEFIPMTLNLGGSNMLRSATYFNFLKNHIINETYEKEYLENVMNKYLATGRINQDEYNELYKMLYPPVYDIELPIEY